MNIPTPLSRCLTACLCACLLPFGALPATAQEATLTPSPSPTTGYYDPSGRWVPPVREHAPNTDGCPQSLVPPEPVSTSEAVLPGAVPAPLPQVYDGPCGVIAPDGFNVDEQVVASAWLVANIDSGEVIAMKDPHGRYRPASIIKVLLALVAIDELPLDAPVPVSAESAGQEGSAAGIGEGGHYTVNDMLHALLMASGNDAAHALAQALGGDERTLAKVNEKAQSLGMRDTRATSYSGLDRPGMSTSAWDMALAYTAAFGNPVFAQIADTASYPFPGFDDLPGFELWNDNQLYLADPDGIGGKTGYTDDANHTFVGAVDHEGQRLVAVILDTTAAHARAWEQAQRLLHEAYRFPASSVAQLRPLSAAVQTSRQAPSQTQAPVTTLPPTQAAPVTLESRGEIPWLSVVVVGGVAVLALLALLFSAASTKKQGRHRQRR